MKDRAMQRRRAGFTLTEMLMTTLILLMVTAIVAAGIPVAVNAYQKVLNAANAQLLLSTTISRLQEELSTAVEVWTDTESSGTTVTYYSHYRHSYKISLENDPITDGAAATEIKLKYTAHPIPGDTEDEKKPKLPVEMKLITGMTETSRFSIKFEDITYNKTQHTFSVNNLKVIDADTGEETDVGRDELIIRPVMLPFENPSYSLTYTSS